MADTRQGATMNDGPMYQPSDDDGFDMMPSLDAAIQAALSSAQETVTAAREGAVTAAYLDVGGDASARAIGAAGSPPKASPDSAPQA